MSASLSWLALHVRQDWISLFDRTEQMKLMFDHAPIGIALFDLDRKVIRCNPAFREIYGWTDDEMIGTIPPLPESQQGAWEELVAGLREGKSFVEVETLRARKNGKHFYARISGSPLYNPRGVLVGLVGFIVKVEDSGYSEQLELCNLEALVQNASDFMCVGSLDRQIFFLNEAGKNILGIIDDQEYIGISIDRLFSTADRGRVLEMIRNLPLRDVGIRTRSLHLRQFETAYEIPVYCSFFLITDPITKEPSSFACVAQVLGNGQTHDPTTSEGEEAFRQLFRNAPVAIALVTTSGELFDTNSRLQEMLGYDGNELRAMRFSELVHPEDLPAGRSLFLRLASGEINRYRVKKRLLTRNGRELQTKMTVALMRTREGHPKYSISIIEQDTEAPA
jgi:PAS domain S-box-containing protein